MPQTPMGELTALPLAGVGVSLAALTFPPSLPNPGSAPAALAGSTTDGSVTPIYIIPGRGIHVAMFLLNRSRISKIY